MREQVEIAIIQAAKEITMQLAKNIAIYSGDANQHLDEVNLQKVKNVYQEVHAVIANAVKEAE